MKKGFTLIELIAVIAILAATITIIIANVENTLENTTIIENTSQIDMIESAALLYAEENTLNNLNTYKVDEVDIETLVNSGYIKDNSVTDINNDNKIVLAIINNNIKAKYTNSITSMPVIFINGDDEISIKNGSTYDDFGSYVAVQESGLIYLEGISNVNTNISGNYTVTYSYTNAISVTRKVNVN